MILRLFLRDIGVVHRVKANTKANCVSTPVFLPAFLSSFLCPVTWRLNRLQIYTQPQSLWGQRLCPPVADVCETESHLRPELFGIYALKETLGEFTCFPGHQVTVEGRKMMLSTYYKRGECPFFLAVCCILYFKVWKILLTSSSSCLSTVEAGKNWQFTHRPESNIEASVLSSSSLSDLSSPSERALQLFLSRPASYCLPAFSV